MQYAIHCISPAAGYIITLINCSNPSLRGVIGKLVPRDPKSIAYAVLYLNSQPVSAHILRISCSFMYFSSPPFKFSHHSNSIEWQMSLNQGVNWREGSSNMAFNPSAVTYRVSQTSLRFGSMSTSALMKRI